MFRGGTFFRAALWEVLGDEDTALTGGLEFRLGDVVLLVALDAVAARVLAQRLELVVEGLRLLRRLDLGEGSLKVRGKRKIAHTDSSRNRTSARRCLGHGNVVPASQFWRVRNEIPSRSAASRWLRLSRMRCAFTCSPRSPVADTAVT